MYNCLTAFCVIFVSQSSNPGQPALEVTHFYYLSWPDHGVPTKSTSLINFIKRVRTIQPHSTEVPLLVHCSAGVGRTGTFIVIDIEMQRIEAEGAVDVYGCLKKLRNRNVLMVQTLVSVLASIQGSQRKKILYQSTSSYIIIRKPATDNVWSLILEKI